VTRSRTVPPGLEYHRKQAKALLKACAAGDPQALARFRQHHPRIENGSGLPAAPRLSDAQLVVAREQGFESWPRFVKHLRNQAAEDAAAWIWKAAERAVISADAEALALLLRDYPQLRTQPPPTYGSGGLRPDYSLPDARAIITREHHFASWEECAAFLAALARRGSPEARFEAAVEAIVTGDAATLRRLLRDDPALIRARSRRTHHAMLLHYVGSNGVESFRQKTPQNIVEIAKILLDAGAEVDAPADMYGGSTTLGLAATSIHPAEGGVQDALIDVLVEHGAAIDRPGSAGSAHSAVNGCLANGRKAAAQHLARLGAALDLEGAAGVGRLDVVRSFFTEAGRLKGGATEAQMKSGLNWACQYGHREVVRFLVERGMDLGEIHRGETGLHWAAYAGHADIVRLLLERGAPVDVKDETFRQTPLGWALYGWVHPPPHADREGYYAVVALLSAAGATVEPGAVPVEAREDPRMAAALS
jgi:hypothetical protein